MVVAKPITINAQTFKIKGKVVDTKSKPLSFANIRIKNTFRGTSANINGNFILHLKKGKYYLITSYIGFKTDTTNIIVNQNCNLKIVLKPTTIKLPTITVKPGINPAISIIKKAIAYKKNRFLKLKTYIYDAYTKIIVKTPPQKANKNKSNYSTNAKNLKLQIAAIIENLSRGYFKSPDLLKEKIIARKQTATIPPTLNIITGSRIFQNFYNNEVAFFGNNILSPIGNGALNYYYYYIKDTLNIDKNKVYKIYFNVIDDSSPGFYGYIFIQDKIFNLLKIDVFVNASANPGGIFNSVHIIQQYLPYSNNIFMPIDYRLNVSGNLLGLFKFNIGTSTVFYNYKINEPLPKEAFSNAIISVETNADSRDSSFWNNNQRIPNTIEEITAYQRIDSVNKSQSAIGKNYSPFSFSSPISNYFRMSGIFSLYYFNRMEGHSTKFSLTGANLLNKRLSGNVYFAYGFNDKKFKEYFYIEYLSGKFRTNKISFAIFNYVPFLFAEYDNYNNFTSTILNLFTKWDFRSYYYRKGLKIKGKLSLNDFISITPQFEYYNDKNGKVNTQFSFFKRNTAYPLLTPINKGTTKIMSLTFNFDFRKYIEDGYFRRRVWGTKPNLIFNVGLSYGKFTSGRSFIFKNYFLDGTINLPGLKPGRCTIKFQFNYSKEIIPFQFLTVLPGNIESAGKDFSFRTIKLNKIPGNQIYSVYLKEKLRNNILNTIGLGFMNKLHLNIQLYLSAAIVKSSENLKSFLTTKLKEFRSPLIEAGFSIGHQLFPINIELTWRLTHRENSKFSIGINSSIM